MAKQEVKKARAERVKVRAERLAKKVAEMEKKMSKRTGDAKLRMFRKRMKRAQRRVVDLTPKSAPAAAEAAAKPA